jgi:hypothetical protein
MTNSGDGPETGRKNGALVETDCVAVDAGPIEPVSPCFLGKCRVIFAKCREAQDAILLDATRSQ